MTFRPYLDQMKKAKITYLLILINLCVFIFVNPGSSGTIALIQQGANFAPFTLDGQPHRLLTSLFLHSNLFHLLMNLYVLLSIGPKIETRIKSLHFLNLFLFSGIIASLASCHLNLFSVSVGASGAIFGLFAFEFLRELANKHTPKRLLIVNFIVLLVISLLLGQRLNLDHYAHAGGFLAGIAFFFAHKLKYTQITTSAIWSLAVFWLLIAPNTQVQYYNAYQYMLQKDQHIRSALNSTYLDQVEQAEKINIIKTLPDSIKIQFDLIENLPYPLREDTALINGFFDMRNQQIGYFLKLLENDSYLYEDSILFIRDLMTIYPRPRFMLNIGNVAVDSTTISIDQTGLKNEIEYYDNNWDVTPYVHKAVYYRKGTKNEKNDWHGKVVDYYKDDDRPQMKGTYFEGLKHGVFIYYNEDGTYASAGIYMEDKQVGKWEYYYTNNILESEVRYVDSYSFIENILDSLGNYMVKDGKGEEVRYFPNGNLRYKRTIEGGLNHGTKEGYYEDGSLYFREYHNEGHLEYGISYDSLGNVYRYEAETEWPFPEGGYDNLIRYFEENNKMKTPEYNDYVELKFNVEKDGSITKIRYIKRISPELDEHAKELLLNGPKWYPARFRGFKKRVKESHVYIRF